MDQQALKQWNEQHPVGTPVLAYPGTRQEKPLYTKTRSEAWMLACGEPVVQVEQRSSGIALTHIDRSQEPIEAHEAMMQNQLIDNLVKQTADLVVALTKQHITVWVDMQQGPGKSAIKQAILAGREQAEVSHFLLGRVATTAAEELQTIAANANAQLVELKKRREGEVQNG